jgi:hypothetical protein
VSMHSIEIVHDAAVYMLVVEVEWTHVDDSFDGHLGGRVHTFEAGHWEVDDFDIQSLTDADGEDVDETEAIADAVRELRRDD